MAKKTYNTIKSAISEQVPNFQNEKVEVLADELDRIQELKVLWNSNEGKNLLGILRSNCAQALTKLKRMQNDRPTLDDLMGILATYFANMDLLASLQDISSEDEISKQLDEAFKEATAYLAR